MVPQWFEPTLSREEAEIKLQQKFTGNFLIRQSSQPGTLALSVKTGRRKDDIQHFIILSRDGSVALEDSDLEFDSLVSLVNYYSSNRDELPVGLRIMEPNRKASAPAMFSRGDSPYVSMVGRQRTKSTIWVNSPMFRTNEGTNPRDLEVIQSVMKQDSSIQDQFSSLLNDCLSTKEACDRLQPELDVNDDKDRADEDDSNKQAELQARHALLQAGIERLQAEHEAEQQRQQHQQQLQQLSPSAAAVAVNTRTCYSEGDNTTRILVVGDNNSADNATAGDHFQQRRRKVVSRAVLRTRPDMGVGEFLEEQTPADEEDYSLPIDQEANVYEIPEVSTEVADSQSTSSTPPSGGGFAAAAGQPKPPAAARQQLSPPGCTASGAGSNSVLNDLIASSQVCCPTSKKNELTVPTKQPRYRKNNSVVENHYRPQELQKCNNLSKSCSNIFEELDKRNDQNKCFRKSFVRKVSLNLSARRNNHIQPIRKLSSVMKKMFPVPNYLTSLVNSQENSESWEYLADCGVSPVYEEVKDVAEMKCEESTKASNQLKQMTPSPQTEYTEALQHKVPSDKSIPRSGSCDSLYESEYSLSNPSSMDRCNPSSMERSNTTLSPNPGPSPTASAVATTGSRYPVELLQGSSDSKKSANRTRKSSNIGFDSSAGKWTGDNVTRISVSAAAASHAQPKSSSTEKEASREKRNQLRRASRNETVYYI